MLIACTAIEEATALFKKRKPSDRDTTQCRVPALYAAEALSGQHSEEQPSTFEFKVCYVRRTAVRKSLVREQFQCY